MAEVITEDAPRIKYSAHRLGHYEAVAGPKSPLVQLSALMAELESCGVIPVLSDGLVGGNCGIAWGAAGVPGEGFLVSRSGKDPGVALALADYVLVESFDREAWSARFRSSAEAARPTSDAPLHAAALAGGACERYGWGEAPLVAVHGHALAEGEGLAVAARLGFPVSHRPTLFSTPEDLEELEALFRECPYPQHRCFVRRGHGFMLLAPSVRDAAAYFEKVIRPNLPPP